MRFPQDFSRALNDNKPVNIQAFLDGRRSNSGQIALGYVREIVQRYSDERFRQPTRASAVQLSVRHWYNPNLNYVYHIIPSLVAIITTISTLVVTALSVAREREQGTLDQLLVSPLTPRELDVLTLLDKRYTDREIAETLVISAATVRSHVQRIGDKLGTHGRHAIVQAAKDQGLL